MRKSNTNPDDHIASLPRGVQEDVRSLDEQISKAFSGEERVLWTGKFWGGSDQEIIGYGHIRYKNTTGDVEWFKIGLAVQKNYISLYVNAVDGKQYLSEKYKDRIGKAKVGKSSISFNSLDDLEASELTSLLNEAAALMK